MDFVTYLALNRPCTLLACICFLRIQGGVSFSRISRILKRNFPEYRRLRPEFIEQIYEDVHYFHPGWIESMRSRELHPREVEHMLDLIESGVFNDESSFPRDTHSSRTMISYLEDLMNTTE